MNALWKRLDELERAASRKKGTESISVQFGITLSEHALLDNVIPRIRALLDVILLQNEALEKLRGYTAPSASTGDFCTADITLPADETLAAVAQMMGEDE